MRKKILVLMFFFVFVLNFNISKVSARGELVYDVTNLTISDTSVVFKGWGVIIGHNNYGGSSSNIKIYALRDGDQNRNNWVTAQLSYNSNYNHSLYEANCVRYSGTGKPCVESYENATCNPNNMASSCRYDNVGFTASFSLKDLFDKLGSDTDISFKIEISNSTANTQISDLGVYVINSNVGNNTIYNGKDFSVSVSNLSEYGKIIESLGRVLSNSQGTFAHGSKFYWSINNSYKIYSKAISNSATIKGLNMYGMYYGTPGGQACYDGSIINGQAQVSGSCPGWAYASWVQVVGKVIINLKEGEKKECENINADLSCDESFEFNSDCDSDVTDTVYGTREMAASQIPSYEAICNVQTSTSLTADVNFNQKGVLSFNNPVLSVYSGGFFTFSSTYENSVIWNYNDEPRCPSMNVSYVATGAKYVCGHESYTVSGKTYTKPKKCACNGSCRSGCISSTTYYSDECPNGGYRGSKTEQDVVKLIQGKYNEISEEVNVTLPDSSPVESYSEQLFNNWSCMHDSVSGWTEGTELKTKCEYKLPNAWINKKTSSIKYTLEEGPNNNYIIRKNEYGVALKQPTGTVYIEMFFPELSVIPTITKWSANYKCGINCQQKFYDIPNGGYLYYFRPISLSEPFPNGREIGINWVDWIADRENQERLLETYTTDNNLEYTVILSSSDIANIKRYNSNLNYSGGRGYLNYSIDINGNSEFVKTYNYFTLGNVNHSGLGVFDPEDDMQ